MIKLSFELDGNIIKEPLNYRETEIEISRDFDSPDFRGQVSTNKWVFGLGANENDDAVKIINDYKNGALGVFVGVDYKIYLDNNNARSVLFDGYLDLSRASYLCDAVEVESVEKYGIDWFNKVVDTVSFKELERKGIISEDDWVLVPYQVYTPGDKTQTIIILVSFSLLLFIIWNFIRSIIALVKSAATGWGWEMIFAIIDLIIALVQLIVQVTAFQNQVFTFLFIERKFKTGMYLKTLCDKGAEGLGYNFESSILDGSNYKISTPSGSLGWDSVALVPKSYQQEEDSTTGLLGFLLASLSGDITSDGYYSGSYGDLLRELKNMFNGKIIIDTKNKVIRLERRDYGDFDNVYQVPEIDRDNTPYELNANDLNGKYNITFTPDEQDKVSLQYYEGTEYEVITDLKAVNPNTINIIQGEQIVDIGFGLTEMKTDLFPQERFVRGVINTGAKILDLPIKILNIGIKGLNLVIKGINKILKVLKTLGIFKKNISIQLLNEVSSTSLLREFLKLYDDQVFNVLMFESDYLTTDKLVALKESYKTYNFGRSNFFNVAKQNKPNKYQRSLLDSEYLWENFHYINSFVEDTDAISSKHNQQKLYNLDKVPFCVDDYNLIKNNPVIRDYDGKLGEMISVKWNIYRQVASLFFKVNDKYTTNLQIFKNKSDGK